MSRLLVTGGGGFIGQHVLETLSGRDLEIYTTSRNALASTPANVRVVKCDLLDSKDVADLLAAVRPNLLMHLAWEATPGTFWTSRNNLRWVAATFNLLHEFVKNGGTRAVFAGSCAEYEWNGLRLSESARTNPATYYGAMKDLTRKGVEATADPSSLETVWTRIFWLYGPGEPLGRLVSDVSLALARGSRVPCSDGLQVRDYMYVRDVAAALVHVLESNVTGIVNVASGQAVTVRAIIEHIAQRLDRRELVEFGVLKNAGPDVPIVADVTRLNTECGFSSINPLATGLAETVDWWTERIAQSEV